jgi:dihydrofolate synthase/folylpolyglutamate synthase
MKSSQQIAHKLFLRTSFGIKMGLDRIKAAADSIGNPQNTYPCFHVAGTNGKGSVCVFLDSCLQSFGLKTALFTSPHILNFEERFIINGKPIKSKKWIEVYYDLKKIIEKYNLTFFESATLIAFELFKREKVEFAVFETGMGGRLDATNILLPSVSIITKIAYDHKQFLGENLISIAKEKLGIIKKGIPLIMAEPEEKTIKDLAIKYCKKMNCEWIFVNENLAKNIKEKKTGISYIFNKKRIELKLHGKYQIVNSLIAIKALKKAGFNDEKIIINGLKKAFIPARFQITKIKNKKFIFDVGHNPNASESFLKTYKLIFKNKKLCIITGIMKDKDIREILKNYCQIANKIILTKPKTNRAADITTLSNQIPFWYKGDIILIENIKNAVEKAFSLKENIISVCGSFYTVGEAMDYLNFKPY